MSKGAEPAMLSGGGSRLRAAAYIRVSTKRQADNELSIAEQKAAIDRWADRNGAEVASYFVERGKSGLSDKRPEFQRMVAEALGPVRPFDVVVVLNLSRFARDEMLFEHWRRELSTAGVAIESATEEFGSGSAGRLARGITTLVDAVSSERNAEVVKLMMNANAHAGWWNGSRPPFGYMTIFAERVGKKDKKTLAVDENEAAVVRLIFRLYLEGDTNSGQPPMGLKRIAGFLGERGIQLRGKPFTCDNLSTILSRETYAGVHHFNRTCSRTKRERPREEWIPVTVPSIIDPDRFDAVQERLASNNRRVTPPRVVNGPTFLTAVAKCHCPGCSGGSGAPAGMILMTGKSGQHRYYMCQLKRRISTRACPSKPYRMDDVDALVISAIEERILHPERLSQLMRSLLDETDEGARRARDELSSLKASITRARAAVSNLWAAVEAGAATPADRDFAERLAAARARVSTLEAEIAVAERKIATPARRITPAAINAFAEIVSKHLRGPDPRLRQAYLKLLVDEVAFAPGQITIKGSRLALEHAVVEAQGKGEPVVLPFARNWRARNDSNVRPSDS
jgi:site-specific DNA recombinase